MTEKKENKLEDLDGVGEAVAGKLRDNGYATVISVAAANPKALEVVLGSKKTARKVQQSARERAGMRVLSWKEVVAKEQRRWYVPTGSTELDNIFGGKGVESGQTVELYGAFASGKTQLALQLLVNTVAKFYQEGEDGAVFIIDTEQTTRPQRMLQMIGGLNKENKNNPNWKTIPTDQDFLNSRIFIIVVYDTDMQAYAVQELRRLIDEEETPIKAVMEDSLMNKYRQEFPGRGTLAERQQKLNMHLGEISKLVDIYNLLYIFTNQVMSKPDQFFGNPETPIGGNIVAHASGVRLSLRRAKAGTNVASLEDSSHLQRCEAPFKITLAGIRDKDWDFKNLEISEEEFLRLYPLTIEEEEQEKTKEPKSRSRRKTKTKDDTEPPPNEEVTEGQTIEEEA